ncbi:hypothetical protein H6P81_019955 [Aristolochia fimbriata]|uniref:DNA-directed RNA polymerase III subunit RPC9 n=1 Tax=Aristolochia fimbriata TaxID=158543 RepID=A0AAV7DT27_ARIFI|nr:hypothetical protein H6P81_019955 [Aristolochia fimbriata]
MKIIEAHAGILTNYEVLDLLKSRGATSDPLGSLGAVTSSESKVFDYLVHTAACSQTREAVKEFWERSDEFELAKAEKLSVINTRPSSEAEIYPIIENCEQRLEGKLEELVSLVVEILPPPPVKPADEQADEMPPEETEGGDKVAE